MIGFDGMTVNERLFHLGLIEKWEITIKSKNRAEAICILILAKYTNQQAINIVNSTFGK